MPKLYYASIRLKTSIMQIQQQQQQQKLKCKTNVIIIIVVFFTSFYVVVQL